MDKAIEIEEYALIDSLDELNIKIKEGWILVDTFPNPYPQPYFFSLIGKIKQGESISELQAHKGKIESLKGNKLKAEPRSILTCWTTPCLTNIEKVQPSYIQLPNGILDLLKATAIGTYTSNGENANDYDALMSADSFGDIPHLVLWEPFENYPIDDIKEYVESEFDSLCSVVKKSIEMYRG